MEALLSHSFDYLSSTSPAKIRKGLRQVEGLLSQLCISRTPDQQTRAESRKLSDLYSDPAYREFFKLQQSFQYNICTRLLSCLERLLGKQSNGVNDLLVIQALDLTQGVLLLHPPSRDLFAREVYMNLFLDLLDPTNCPAIQSSTLLALVTCLLDFPKNTRTFESLDGLLVVTSLFKSRTTNREVKMKLVEFLYFYLMPEVPSPSRPQSSADISVLGGRGHEIHEAFEKNRQQLMGTTDKRLDQVTKSTEEKQQMLGRYMNNVGDLVDDLRDGAPFGD